LTPSIRNCTPTTPTLSEAVAETVMEPETVAALAGAVMETVGGVESTVPDETQAFRAKFSPLAASAAPVRSSSVTVMLLCPGVGCCLVAGADQNGLKLAAEKLEVLVATLHPKSSTICLPLKCFSRYLVTFAGGVQEMVYEPAPLFTTVTVTSCCVMVPGCSAEKMAWLTA